jgi:endo-1,4-beta-xylanase
MASILHSNEIQSLHKAHKENFLIGNVYNNRKSTPKNLEILKQHFNVITPENCGKWSATQPKEGRFNFSKMDKLMDFAEANNMKVVGHTLVWGNQTPNWVFKGPNGEAASKELLIRRMKLHIKENMNRYKGRIKYWDVVNEAFNGNGSYKKNQWYDIIGPEYLEIAFGYAHKIDPDAKLLYNDYNMNKDGRVDAVIDMVKRLRSKNIPIHAVGMQGHWAIDYPESSKIEETIMKFKKIGVPIHITELDISVLPSPYRGANITNRFVNRPELDPYTNGLPEEIEKKHANRYQELFELFIRTGNVKRVSIWGLSDIDSWKNDHPVKGRTEYALLYDRAMQPKAAMKAILSIGDSSYLNASPVNKVKKQEETIVNTETTTAYTQSIQTNDQDLNQGTEKQINSTSTTSNPKISVPSKSKTENTLKWNTIEWSEVDWGNFEWNAFYQSNKTEVILLSLLLGTLIITSIAVISKLSN